LPADLLRRRPDVRSAERAAAFQSEQVGIATADLFPSISVGGSFGYKASDANDGSLNNNLFDSGSRVWSSAIDYKRVPGNDQPQTQALIESIEYLVLHFASVVHFREQSVEALEEPLRKQLEPGYDACIESLQLISNSLADLPPIPDLPDTTSLIREVESRGDDLRQSAANQEKARASFLRFRSASSQLHSLVVAIGDCRDKANALDWAAWDRNYF
jgi:hypothetical protein